MALELQFTADDIVAGLDRIAEKSRSGEIPDSLKHEVMSDFHVSGGVLHKVLEDSNLSRLQRAYVSNARYMGGDCLRVADEIVNAARDRDKERIQKAAHQYVELLGRLSVFYPLAGAVHEIAAISDKGYERLLIADNRFGAALYTANALFADRHERETYRLREDISTFVALEVLHGIDFDEPVLHDVVTREDYMTNAVLPILRNAQDHAGNPENNVFERDEDPVLVVIGSEVDESQNLVRIDIADSGFGVRPEIYGRLWTRGATTRSDTTAHGIGLYSVRRFVESQGGTVACETELGKGSMFSFTIPYSLREGNTYLQR